MRRAFFCWVFLLVCAFAHPQEGTLTVLHTSGLKGRVDSENGLAFLASEVRRVRRESRNVLLLDGGDTFFGTSVESEHRGKGIAAAMRTLDYDAAVFGTTDFDGGVPAAAAASRASGTRFLGANLMTRGQNRLWQAVKPYTVLRAGGVRVAVIGLTTPATSERQGPRPLQGVLFVDPREAAAKWVPEMRRRADIVVALTHLEEAEDVRVAAAITGIDLVIAGHPGVRVASPIQLQGASVIHGPEGELRRIDLRVRREEGRPPQVLVERVETLAPSTIDPAVVNAYRKFSEPFRKNLDRKLASVAVSPSRASLTVRVAEAVREATKADVGIFDEAGLEGVLPEGTVRERDARRVVPWRSGSYLVVFEATGAELKAAVKGAFRISAPGGVDEDKKLKIAAPASVVRELFGTRLRFLSDEPEGPTAADALVKHLERVRVVLP